MVVVADDITGAAEMAGIAFRFGLRAHLQLCSPSNTQQLLPPPSTGRGRGWVSILATDTRGMSEDEAVAETRHIATKLFKVGAFKKTDSALRGHVVAELTTLMETIGYQRAVYMPANPSKDRIIKDGVYLIKGVPIHETAFSYDPEFPAKTSVLRERFPDAENHHIIMPDAETLDDICHIVETYNDGHTLFAGAADLFEAWLKSRRPNDPTPTLPKGGGKDGGLLVLCGSTQSKPLDLGIPEYPMPRAVYDGEAPVTSWIEEIKEGPAGAILSFGTNTHRTGKEAAVYLRNAMAEAATAFINTHHPQEIVIEGGATAFCLLNRLGWHHFRITNEIAPGVVRMEYLPPSLNHQPSTVNPQPSSLNPQPSTLNRQPSTLNPQPSTVNPQPSTFITLKPGSYPWGDLWKKL